MEEGGGGEGVTVRYRYCTMAIPTWGEKQSVPRFMSKHLRGLK